MGELFNASLCLDPHAVQSFQPAPVRGLPQVLTVPSQRPTRKMMSPAWIFLLQTAHSDPSRYPL